MTMDESSKQLTTARQMIAIMTTIGAKLISFRFMVVVQQKSRGSLNSFWGPRAATMGGLVVALIYGLGTIHRSSDQTSTCMAIVLRGRYNTVRMKVAMTRPQSLFSCRGSCRPSEIPN